MEKIIQNGMLKPQFSNNDKFRFEQVKAALNLIRRKTYAILKNAEEYQLNLHEKAECAYNWLQNTAIAALEAMVETNQINMRAMDEIFSGMHSKIIENNPVVYTDEEKEIGYISFRDVYQECPASDQRVIERLFDIADLVINGNNSYRNALKIAYNH